MNYTVIGEPVNLAQRLETLARAGEIVMGESTRDLLPSDVDLGVGFEPMGSVRLKGILKDVTPLRVVYG